MFSQLAVPRCEQTELLWVVSNWEKAFRAPRPILSYSDCLINPDRHFYVGLECALCVLVCLCVHTAVLSCCCWKQSCLCLPPSLPSFETWPRADLLILSPSLPTVPGPMLHQPVRAQLHCLCSDHHPPKHRHSPRLNHGRHLIEHKEMHRGLKLDKCWQEQGFAP